MLNRIIVIGRLTRDPEMKYTPQGVPVATLGIAVDRFTKDENGNKEVDFFNIVAWRRTAEFASNYLTKGRLVSVDGRLQTRSYVAQDGQKRTVYEIVAENLEGLERKSDVEASSSHMGDGAGMETERAVTTSAPTPAPRPAAAVGAGASGASGGSRKPAPPPVDDDLDESDPFADE